MIRARMSMRGLFIPQDASWRLDFESELLRFPAGVHDDKADALGDRAASRYRSSRPRREDGDTEGGERRLSFAADWIRLVEGVMIRHHRWNSCGLHAFASQDTGEDTMTDDKATKTEAAGTLPPGHPLDPSESPPAPAESAGPTSPGHPDPAPDRAPESGGYDGKPPSTGSGNTKGGYGAG